MENQIDLYLKNIKKEYSTGKTTEHSFRPALKTFVESLKKGISATNEPTREECGAPDFIVQKKQIPLGYIECKDIIWPLDPIEKNDQLKRYRSALNNLILTNYLEFRYYVQGERKMTVPIARIDSKKKIQKIAESDENLSMMFDSFFAFRGPSISTPKDLAERMAKLAQLIRATIKKAFELESKKGKLHGQFEAFKKVLLNNLTEDQFADMYAQTICYGLFAARCNVTGKNANNFTREHAAFDLPKTNPFLREIFGQIAGPDLDESITWVVDDLAELLSKADIDSILADFGKATKQEDPIVHFYETFLSQYDPKMRESRGVYYTPEPVVSYIVRSVDHILKTDFGLKDGLADSTMIKHEFENPETHEKEERTVHKVQILDPAVGTGTFLYGVINQIHDKFLKDKGMWSGYVSQHLLPRLFGFELLMAPYAVAHMKLGLLLKETGYDFTSDERLRVYLTNTLEKAHDYVEEAFANLIAEEANRASEVKKDVPVMVVLGNPPYSYESVNNGPWISKLIRDYYKIDNKSIGEKNPKGLQDDYVKFFRFAQWRIHQTGYGILAFISNHGFLDNPTFRGMRQNLLKTFNQIFILDLHGNVKKKEKKPDGGVDENVFDIQQGVSIGIFIKNDTKGTTNSKIMHCDLFGSRDNKYAWLSENAIHTTLWKKLKPEQPFYFLVPFNTNLLKEYNQYYSLKDIFPVNSVGIATFRDKLTIQWSPNDVFVVIKDLSKLSIEAVREKYNLGPDSQDWKVDFAQKDILNTNLSEEKILPISYRPFDARYTFYTGVSNGFHCRPRPEVMRHFQDGENVGICFVRRSREKVTRNFFVIKGLVDKTILSSADNANCAPLYLYDPPEKIDLFNSNKFPIGHKVPNLNKQFIKEISDKTGFKFLIDGKGNLNESFGPLDIFNYIYSIFHSPTYRTRYAEFLKMDFPRVPITSDVKLFRKLCALGEELVGLHLLEKVPGTFTNYPIKGDDIVEKPIYVEQKKGKDAHNGRVYINKSQYFENVPPEVWEFHVGGYQVCHKWLKDRKGRNLSYDDISHYKNIVVALSETIRIMSEIDKAIPKWPIE